MQFWLRVIFFDTFLICEMKILFWSFSRKFSPTKIQTIRYIKFLSDSLLAYLLYNPLTLGILYDSKFNCHTTHNTGNHSVLCSNLLYHSVISVQVTWRLKIHEKMSVDLCGLCLLLTHELHKTMMFEPNNHQYMPAITSTCKQIYLRI